MMNSLSVCFCSTLWSKNSNGLRWHNLRFSRFSSNRFAKAPVVLTILLPRLGQCDQKGSKMIWAQLLAYVTGTVDQELLLRNVYRTLSRGAQPSGQRQSDLVSFADGGKKGRGSSAVPRTTGRPAEVLREGSGITSMGQRAMGSQ